MLITGNRAFDNDDRKYALSLISAIKTQRVKPYPREGILATENFQKCPSFEETPTVVYVI